MVRGRCERVWEVFDTAFLSNNDWSALVNVNALPASIFAGVCQRSEPRRCAKVVGGGGSEVVTVRLQDLPKS